MRQNMYRDQRKLSPKSLDSMFYELAHHVSWRRTNQIVNGGNTIHWNSGKIPVPRTGSVGIDGV